MKKIAIALCLICATSALCAPVPQASQAWVNMKLSQLRADILAEIDAGNTNGLSETEVVANAVTRGMADMNSIIAASLTSSAFIYTNAHPMYVITGVYPAYTNFVDGGAKLEWKQNGVYTNQTATLTELGATNKLAVGVYELFCPTNSVVFEPSVGDGYIFAVKIKSEVD